jgi:hypothetical protein
MGLLSISSGHVQYNIHMSPLYRHKLGTACQQPSCSVYSLASCIQSQTACSARVKLCSASIRLAGTFDLLVYTDAASNVPTEWEDSDPRFIQNAADVKLRSFTTKVRMPYPLNCWLSDDPFCCCFQKTWLLMPCRNPAFASALHFPLLTPIAAPSRLLLLTGSQFSPAGACMSAIGHCRSFKLQMCHLALSLCMQVHKVDALVSYRADDD